MPQHGLSLSEATGVFVGVLGMDWLVDGYAQPLRALAVTVALAVMIILTQLGLRYWRQRGTTPVATSSLPASRSGPDQSGS